MDEYPKWLYRPNEAVLVEDADAERALGPGWFATPDAVEERAPKRRKGGGDADDR